MFRIVRVTGDSLSPDVIEGDFVVILKIPFSFKYIKPGDLVAFNTLEYGLLIKRVDHIDPQGGRYFVLGTNDLSIDSRHLGLIDHDDLHGKVIWHIKQR